MSPATPPESRAAACSTSGVPGCSLQGGRPTGEPLPDPRPAPPVETAGGDEELLPAPAHPWELPLLAVCVTITLALAAGALHLLWTLTASVVWTLAPVPAVLAVCWVARGLRYARHRAESVKVSPTQFPETHRLVVSLSEAMGLARAPEVYVSTERHPRRTDASAHGLRRYLVLCHDVFEVGEHGRDPEALAFLVAHQIGHVAAGHTGYWRRVSTLGAELLPGVGAALSRAQEYTADHHAHAHLPEAAHAVRLLAGGRRLYRRVNMGEMADRARTDRGCSLLLYHLLARRPSNTRRMAALRDRSRPGRVFL
ncbi:M48 family metallopeptidase [Nocardiopsis sp. HNM0947]|uniref:M48 family metallopeptidase n=1 Tax=Nocardiopsis coralli TaxID=2772213 RepID=A0ABR9P4P0_9ACTN|nr:M48 family metallopeptidase [Nocardiopsis coralli]MBE2998809.1 M48 family metallopeptidase [Nocardiopsis coralli]